MVLAASLLDRQARLGAIEGLDLALLVKRQHHGMAWRVDNAAARHFGYAPNALWVKLEMPSIPSDQVVERGGRYFETYSALAEHRG
jgi:hypothetical protein